MIEGTTAEEPAEILIVDDDPDVRVFVRAVLESDGHQVIEAGSGQEAIQRLRIRRPSLVLLDVMMPAMDGFAVVHAIKREPGPFVPVILLTALDDPASRAKGINAGADEILAKPVHPFELRLRCRAMLRIHQLTEDLHAANKRLRALARTDELTDVRNRRGLRSALTREFRRAERYGGALTVIAFDVDRFKQVNDMYGHAVGDKVLYAVAQALKRGVREVDVVGRVGGEEFVVLAPETPSHDALQLGQRLRKAIGERVVTMPAGGEVRVTASCGIATLSEVHARTPEELLGYADSALYRAKALGRDRCEVAELVLDEEGKRLPPPAPMTQKMALSPAE
ncbi:MAG: response regulator receiver modulated diguanylate cyclase [Myxococcales bacterium]|nr:response regulator receiver modulated diguanylate cyclase [Myxococcales bacterium]